MLRGLIRQVDRYERLLDCPDMDNQAAYAYAAMFRQALGLIERLRPEARRDPEEMRRVVEEMLEREYGIRISRSEETAPPQMAESTPNTAPPLAP